MSTADTTAEPEAVLGVAEHRAQQGVALIHRAALGVGCGSLDPQGLADLLEEAEGNLHRAQVDLARLRSQARATVRAERLAADAHGWSATVETRPLARRTGYSQAYAWTVELQHPGRGRETLKLSETQANALERAARAEEQGREPTPGGGRRTRSSLERVGLSVAYAGLTGKGLVAARAIRAEDRRLTAERLAADVPQD